MEIKDIKKKAKEIAEKLSNKKVYDKLTKEEKKSIHMELLEVLVKCDFSYYNNGIALIPNSEYDKLEKLFEKLEKEVKGWNK